MQSITTHITRGNVSINQRRFENMYVLLNAKIITARDYIIENYIHELSLMKFTTLCYTNDYNYIPVVIVIGYVSNKGYGYSLENFTCTF